MANISKSNRPRVTFHNKPFDPKDHPNVKIAKVISSEKTYHIENSQFQRVLNELESIKDYDRGLILVTVSMIEAMCIKLMIKLVPDKNYKHFKLKGMLELLYSRKIIAKDDFEYADALRSLRNTAGHELLFELVPIEKTRARGVGTYHKLCVMCISKFWNTNPAIFKEAFLTHGVSVVVE